VKRYWEVVADNLSACGWSWGCVSAVDSSGRTIWIADAHRALLRAWRTKTVALRISKNTASVPVWMSCVPIHDSRSCLKKLEWTLSANTECRKLTLAHARISKKLCRTKLASP
jgi:hypothetical protein